MPLGEHAAHWANYLGELVRELPLHYPSWRQVPAEQKAGIMAQIGTQFDMRPHMESDRWPLIYAAIQQHLQKIYNGKKAALKERHWIPDSDGTYDLERIRLSRPSHISEVNWDAPYDEYLYSPEILELVILEIIDMYLVDNASFGLLLDIGCGVASYGGYLFDRDVLAMSFAPKDEHEAQVQFALERGIPAISAVMGTQRLPYHARVFDIVHCARCTVPWHIEGGKLLLELNCVLRPGGYFVWSATPIYQKLPEDVGIWEAMKKLTKLMCWEVKAVGKDKVNKAGVAVYQKLMTNECYEGRQQNEPPLCKYSDDPNAAWKVPLQACMHKVPVVEPERGSKWPEQWPLRAEKAPYWLLSSQVGVYGKPAPEDFSADFKHWKRVVNKSY
ncbi:probable methyltransferase PMT26 [Tanacetum coccineum]